MVKKIMFLVGVIVIYLVIGQMTTVYNLIPEEAIRIRVIANSDSLEDQHIKEEVRKNLEEFFAEKLKDATGVSEAIAIIVSSIPEAEEIIINTLGNDDFQLNYGMNYFPNKEYKGIKYKAGYYQSLAVSIGNGVGANWWCILFPPLCFLDRTEVEEVEYRSLVADIVKKYF